MQVTASGIIPCSIVSNHDSLYACINVRVPHFEPRYKFIRDTKSLGEQLFIDNFSELPLSVTPFLDDPDEQLDSLNLLFAECPREMHHCRKWKWRILLHRGWRHHI